MVEKGGCISDGDVHPMDILSLQRYFATMTFMSIHCVVFQRQKAQYGFLKILLKEECQIIYRRFSKHISKQPFCIPYSFWNRLILFCVMYICCIRAVDCEFYRSSQDENRKCWSLKIKRELTPENVRNLV